MKNIIRNALAFTGSIICMAVLSAFAFAADIDIVFPSDDESTIAVGNNFYVIGTIDGGEDITLSVELYSKGDMSEPLRRVYTDRRNFTDGIYYGYEGLSYYGEDITELKNSFMPDLVYDGENPETFKDAWRKCYVGENAFTALIYASESPLGLNFRDEDGTPYEEIPAGEYTILVTVTEDGNDTYAQKDIVIGTNSDKVCARFSPDAHFDAVMNFAEKNGFRVYTDPFAGYWSTGAMPDEIADTGIFFEIKGAWRDCEYNEYINGTVHSVLYNIKQSSTSNSVEFGVMQETGRIDEGIYYYYTLAEPVLTLNGEQTVSEIKTMETGDKLQLTRINGGASLAENVTDTTLTPDIITLWDGSKIDLTENNGKMIQIMGVLAPIQNEQSDIVKNDDLTYTVNNYIAKLQYTVTDKSGNILDEFDRDSGLSRVFGEDWTELSIYEFANVLDLSRYETDEITISVKGLDIYGNEAAGAEEILTVILSDNNTEKPDVNTGDNANTAVLILLIASSAVFAAAAKRGLSV